MKYGKGGIEINGLEQQIALVRFYFGTDYSNLQQVKVRISPWWKFWDFRHYTKEVFDIDGFFKSWGQLEFALAFEGKIKKEVIKKG